MGEYTYLVGLAIAGAMMFTVGMVAAARERRAHRAGERPAAASDHDDRRSSRTAHAQ